MESIYGQLKNRNRNFAKKKNKEEEKKGGRKEKPSMGIQDGDGDRATDLMSS
jgi:hypothetical protein